MTTPAVDWKQRASELVREDEAFASALVVARGERQARRLISEIEVAAIAYAAAMKRRKDPEAALAVEVRRLKKSVLAQAAGR